MKQKLTILLQQAIENLKQTGILDKNLSCPINVEHTKDSRYGDFSTNLAFILAKAARTTPLQLAEKIISSLPDDTAINKTEVAGAGFINFFIQADAHKQIIKRIYNDGNLFGCSQIGDGKKIQVEFVSANPTGPLHVGHGRGAAYGSAVASLLRAVGFEVSQEYYVNDAGRQMDILATSIWLRYLQICGEAIAFPCNGYRGDYIKNIAGKLHQDSVHKYCHPAALVVENIVPDEPHGGDKEAHIDALIERAKTLLGTSLYNDVLQKGVSTILSDIKEDLEAFKVYYQNWFSEQQLMADGSVQAIIQSLDKGGFLYQKEGATWFAASRLGDEKDRVVIRNNQQTTYFASDIAYHINKLNRGFTEIINIWGADHHGYIPRIMAAIKALNHDATKITIKLVQFATLYRGKEKLAMSTRSGEFVTLRQLRDEVGTDAARFFYVMRKSEQHMDFDLNLAASKTNDNPVFYVQYAHARISSVLKQLADFAQQQSAKKDWQQDWQQDAKSGMQTLHKLTQKHETALLITLCKYAQTVERAALQHEPHHLTHYLRELAHDFHTYYNAHQFLIADAATRNARLHLIRATQQVLANGLTLLNIDAPEYM